LFVVVVVSVWVAVLEMPGGDSYRARAKLRARDALTEAYRDTVSSWTTGEHSAFVLSGIVRGNIAVRARLVGAGPVQKNGNGTLLVQAGGWAADVDAATGRTLVPGWQMYADEVINDRPYPTTIMRYEVMAANSSVWDEEALGEDAAVEVEFVSGNGWWERGEDEVLSGWGVRLPLMRDVPVDLDLCNEDGPEGWRMEDPELRAKCTRSVCESANGTMWGAHWCFTRRMLSRVCLSGKVVREDGARGGGVLAADAGEAEGATPDPEQPEGLDWRVNPSGHNGCGDWDESAKRLGPGSWRASKDQSSLSVVFELRSESDPRVRLLDLSRGALHFGYVDQSAILVSQGAGLLLFLSLAFLCCCGWISCCAAWGESTEPWDERAERAERRVSGSSARRVHVESAVAPAVPEGRQAYGEGLGWAPHVVSTDDDEEAIRGVPVGSPLVPGTIIPMHYVEVEALDMDDMLMKHEEEGGDKDVENGEK